MKVYKIVSPFKQLNSFASDNNWHIVGELVKSILDNDLETEFNHMMNVRFKGGIGDKDFESYCLENASFILDELNKTTK